VEPEATDGPFTYRVGDAIGLACTNDPADLDSLLAALGRAHQSPTFSPDAPITLTYAATGAPADPLLPPPFTARRVLSTLVDLSAPLKPGLLRALASYTADPTERAALEFLSAKKGPGRDAFVAFVADQALHLAELLECFPSCAPTLGCLAAALPPLTARFYSLTSCPATSPDKVSVAFSVVEWDAAGVGRKGLCTSQLEALVAPALAGAGAGSNVAGMPPLSLTLKPATDFTVPTDLTRPVIMIGPGTGVAPFMGFIDARRAQYAAVGGKPADAAPMRLYFGCRHEAQDWLYREEMEAAVADGTLDALRTAFSRDGPSKVYVQHRLAEDAAELATLITEGGCVFVCGDGMHMAKDVHAALVDLLAPTCGGSKVLAEDFLRTMRENERYVQDIWS